MIGGSGEHNDVTADAPRLEMSVGPGGEGISADVGRDDAVPERGEHVAAIRAVIQARSSQPRLGPPSTVAS